MVNRRFAHDGMRRNARGPAPGGGGEGTPLDMFTDVLYWFRPDLANVTLDGTEVTGIVNGGSLGDHALPITDVGAQMTHVAADANFNGMPSLFFDGVLDEKINLIAPGAQTEMEVFVVWRKAVDTPPTTATAYTWGLTTVGGDQWIPHSNDSEYFADGSTVRRGPIAHVRDHTVPFTYHAIATASEHTIKLDNVNVFTTPTNTVNYNAAPFIGAKGGLTFRLHGYIADWIVCGSEQSAGARDWFYNEYIPRYGL